MAKKKSIKKVKDIVPEDLKPYSQHSQQESISAKSAEPFLKQLLLPKNLVIIIVVIIALLIWKFRSYFIVATVNGQPISRFELNDLMNKRYASQVLDGLVSERLIMGATRSKGILITKEEIDQKEEEIKKRLGNQMPIEKLLEAQGMTQQMFRRQIEVQLAVDKLFDKEATVSAKDVDDYVGKNPELAKNSTDPAALKKDVKEILRQQKINDLFQTWFEDIKKNANIAKFI